MLGNLKNLMEELTRQRQTAKDFVAHSCSLTVGHRGSRLFLEDATEHGEASQFLTPAGLPLSDHAVSQLAGYQGVKSLVPCVKDLLGKRPELASHLLGNLMQESPKKHLVRCLDDRVRAVLSDRYRVLDNHDLVFTALSAAEKVEAFPLRCKLTENRMELQLTTRQIWEVIEVDQQQGARRGTHWSYGGDASPQYREALGVEEGPNGGNHPETVHPLVTISNSETGAGGLKVSIGILRAACINGVIVSKEVSQVHLGGKLEEGLYRPETMEQDAKAIMMKATDAIQAAFHPHSFGKLCNEAQAAEAQKIEAPVEAVGNVVKACELSEEVKDNLLEKFLGGYQSTAYGLAQAVARVAQDVKDEDEQTRLEEVAGDLIKRPAMAVLAA